MNPSSLPELFKPSRDLNKPKKTQEIETQNHQKLYLFTEMDIAQNLAIRIGPKLEEMNPRSLPEVFKQPRDLNNSQKPEK